MAGIVACVHMCACTRAKCWPYMCIPSNVCEVCVCVCVCVLWGATLSLGGGSLLSRVTWDSVYYTSAADATSWLITACSHTHTHTHTHTCNIHNSHTLHTCTQHKWTCVHMHMWTPSIVWLHLSWTIGPYTFIYNEQYWFCEHDLTLLCISWLLLMNSMI